MQSWGGRDVAEVWLPVVVLVAGAALVGFILVRGGALLTPETASLRRVRLQLMPSESRWGTALFNSAIGRSLQDRFAIRRLQLVAGRGDAQAFARHTVAVAGCTVMAGAVVDAITAFLDGQP